MNRSNVGNVITNGMQILSVSGTTASKFLGEANSALNNLSKEERQAYTQMKADKMRDETKQYNTLGANATQHLTDSELTNYRSFQADNMRKQMRKGTEDKEDIDSIMSSYKNNSEQVKDIQIKIKNDVDFIKNWKADIDKDFIDTLVDKGEI